VAMVLSSEKGAEGAISTSGKLSVATDCESGTDIDVDVCSVMM
jgi:hypothetical protein